MNWRRFWLRVTIVISGASAGMLAALACNSDDCNCPEPKSIALGEFRIRAIKAAEAQGQFSGWVERGATLEIARGSATIVYESAEGEVRVEYRASDDDAELAP